MVKREVFYFEDFGAQNTEQTIKAARDAVVKLRVGYVVVASATGATGVKTSEMLKDTGVHVIVVTEHSGMADFKDDNKKKLKEMGVEVITSTHSFYSPAESISKLCNGYCSENVIIQNVLRRFSQGMNVVADIVMMATDAGAIPPNIDVVAIGGTAVTGGADTAVIIKSCYSENFFDKEKGMEFREIIAMPLKKKFY